MNHAIFYFRRLLVLLFITIAFVVPALSQAGSNDATFNTTDLGAGGANGAIVSIAIQNDQKIIIAGGFTTYNGTARNYIARLNTDGSLDAGFNPGTGTNSNIQAMAVQSDGKIIIAGLFTSFNGTVRNNIARLNTDGSLDATFNPGTGSNSTIYTIAIQKSDGKVIIGGAFTAYNGTTSSNIARLNTDGTIDAGFNPGSAAGAIAYATAIQTDNKIIIAGIFKIARLNTDGTKDAGFTPGTANNNTVRSCLLQTDGKIIIAGLFTTYNGTARSKIARLNADGTLDAGFNPGTSANNTIYTSAIQGDGKIIIAGLFTAYNGTVINRIARLNTDGTIDAGFNPGTGGNNTIFSSALQGDGKIIIGGLFTTYNDVAKTRVTRVLVSGGASAAAYFRSIASGNWNAPATWESSPVADFSSGVISPATSSPDGNATAITIRGPHTVTVTATVIAPKTTLNSSGKLIVNTGVTLTVK